MTRRDAGREKSGRRGRRARAERGFYSEALREAEALDFELAHGIEGIDDEIALLRLRIKSLCENDPENVRLFMEATTTLARLVMARYRISADQKKALTSAISGVLQGLALPLGIKYLP